MRLRDWFLALFEWFGILFVSSRTLESQRNRQFKSLKRILEHAKNHVPVYRTALKDFYFNTWKDLEQIPLLTRQQIQKNPETFMERGKRGLNWKESHTSGSTGQPLYTFFNRSTWRFLRYVLKFHRLIQQGFRPGNRVVIVDDYDPRQIKEHLSKNFLPGEGWLNLRKYVSVFAKTESHFADYLSFRPHFIYGFPSYFVELAKCWDRTARRRVPLKALMTSAESLSLTTRKHLEKVFGVPVLDVYGSTEFKEVAWQCPQAGKYHLNTASTYVEIIKNGKPVPDGEDGEIVLTTLSNRAMPLIRYRTGDQGSLLKEKCSCGRPSPLLGNIQGRTVDYVPVPELGFLSPYDFTTTLSVFREILQFKIIRRREKVLEVKVVLKDTSTPEILGEIQKVLEDKVRHKIRVFVQPVDEIPRTKAGKHQLISVEALQEVTS